MKSSFQLPFELQARLFPYDRKVSTTRQLTMHRGDHLPGRPSRKYSQQRAGPFIVKRRVGRLAYELDLPDTMGIHPVISVTHLAPSPDGKDGPF